MLKDGDLGLIGRATGIVEEYKRAVEVVSTHVKTGAANLATAGDNLKKAADLYEAQDERYYDAFGYTTTT